MKRSILSLVIVWLTVTIGMSQTTSISSSDDELISAATTRPWPGKAFPTLPNLDDEIRQGVIGEIASRRIRAAYVKLDGNRRNIEWFEGVDELEKGKAVWSLVSCLIHPHDDVQANALRALERLGNKKAVPFLLKYAEAMDVWEDGSENATVHGLLQTSIAETLSSLTGIKVVVSGQDPERLREGITLWKKWLSTHSN